MLANNWRLALKYDPLNTLLSCNDQAVLFFANKELLGRSTNSVESLWSLPDAKRIAAAQQANGSWKYPGGNSKVRTQENYDQLETFRNLGFLVEMYGFNHNSQVIKNAAEFLFSHQTSAGDIRGILGNQYAPYYSAAMAELLIKAGYTNDKRIIKMFDWLKEMRQDDGGWAIPLRTKGKKLDVISMEAKTLEPDKTKPFSHLVTGVVLRAYAAHPKYRKSEEAKQASKLLIGNFFKSDNYPDRKNADYWAKSTFPFWFTDLISAMDSVSQIGFAKNDPQVGRAVQWFINNQQPDGLWKLKILKNLKYNNDLWLSLAICRIFRRLY